MNDKVLIITILSLLAIGIVGVLFVAIPWIFHGPSDWKDTLLNDGLIVGAIVMFVYGFYVNTKMN